MKKIYSLKKEILFKNNIYEIVSIAIDKKFAIDEYALKGQFQITGEYLVTENEQDNFDIIIPYLNYIEDIYKIDKIKVDIDDFYYEIKDSNKLIINIDIMVDGLEEKELVRNKKEDMEVETDNIAVLKTINEEPKRDIIINDIDIDNEIKTNIISDKVEIEKEENKILKEEGTHAKIEEPKLALKENDIEEKTISSEDIQLKDEELKEERKIQMNSEGYVTYKIYVFREGDTIEKIIDKYNISMDNLLKYNIINELNIGDKIIIPYERN